METKTNDAAWNSKQTRHTSTQIRYPDDMRNQETRPVLYNVENTHTLHVHFDVDADAINMHK